MPASRLTVVVTRRLPEAVETRLKELFDVELRDPDVAMTREELAEAMRRVAAAGWRLGNLDATIVAQAPKMAPHIPAMRTRIAQLLSVSAEQVNVKAKTAEKMGPVGEGRSIETRAVCLLLPAA